MYEKVKEVKQTKRCCKKIRWILQHFVYNRSSRNNMKSGKELKEYGNYLTSI